MRPYSYMRLTVYGFVRERISFLLWPLGGPSCTCEWLMSIWAAPSGLIGLLLCLKAQSLEGLVRWKVGSVSS